LRKDLRVAGIPVLLSTAPAIRAATAVDSTGYVDGIRSEQQSMVRNRSGGVFSLLSAND